MKKIYFWTAISALSLLLEGCTDPINNSVYSNGNQKYGKEVLDGIHANGSITLEGTTILGHVFVNGSLNAEESSMGSIQVNGQVELKNCVINNTTTINGYLNAENTRFQKELSIASQKITLTTCIVDSLIVRKIQGYNGAQVIDLRGRTKIKGPIRVEAGNGEIWISSDSEISEQVSGAKVYKK